MAVNVLERVATKNYTLEEYFELEEKAIYKSEYQNGNIEAMSGGTISHSVIGGNAYFYLRMALKSLEKDFKAFSNDQKIYLPALNQVVYADSCVVAGEVEVYQSSNQLITNPALIVEVLSNSTAGYDRGEKFRKYQTLPSFQEYILVDQTQPIVDVLYKEANLKWRLKTYIGLDEILKIESIGIELKMKDLYEDVEGLQDPQFKLAV